MQYSEVAVVQLDAGQRSGVGGVIGASGVGSKAAALAELGSWPDRTLYGFAREGGERTSNFANSANSASPANRANSANPANPASSR